MKIYLHNKHNQTNKFCFKKGKKEKKHAIECIYGRCAFWYGRAKSKAKKQSFLKIKMTVYVVSSTNF